MKGLFSLWTGTPGFELSRGPMLVATLAICCASRVFRGVELVTDDYGAIIARSLGWKLPLGLALNRFEPSDRRIWAMGKLFALSVQQEPSIHIDLDVILLKRLPRRLIEEALIAQSLDYPLYYATGDTAAAITQAGLPVGVPAYNAGLIGGASLPLVKAMAWHGMAIAESLRGTPNGTAASMVAEQYGLGLFARRTGVQVGTLLSAPDPAEPEVRGAGFIHLHGDHKQDPYYLNRAELRLAQNFPAAYKLFTKGWRTIQP